MNRNFPIILIVLITIAVIAVALVNGSTTTLNVLAGTVQIPTGLLLGGSYVLGLILSFPLMLAKLSSNKASQKQLTIWENQDNKLAQQIQSDKEKQLEAKVATLEAALSRALKK